MIFFSFVRTEFKDDPYIYAFDSLKHIGIELWQVSASQVLWSMVSIEHCEAFVGTTDIDFSFDRH